MLSTESANASSLLLPALKNWLSSSNNDITTTGVKLCVECGPPTSSGLSSNPDDGYTTGEFVAVLVLFLVTMVIAVVLGVTLLLLLCSKYNVSSRVGYGCLFIVYTMSSLLKRDVIYVSAYAALLYGYTQIYL